MKTFLAFLLLLSAGCNQYSAELAVRRAFPNAQVKSGDPLPKYHFLIKDGNEIYLANCYGTWKPEAYTKDLIRYSHVEALFK